MGWQVEDGDKDKSYKDITDILTVKVKEIRNILTTVKSQYFCLIWEEGSDEDRAKMLSLVFKADKNRLNYWLLQHRLVVPSIQPFWYLKEQCQRHGITNYGRMGRPELIKMVESLNGQD